MFEGDKGGKPTRVRHLNKRIGLECIFDPMGFLDRVCMTYPAELTQGGFSSADVNAVISYVLSRSTVSAS